MRYIDNMIKTKPVRDTKTLDGEPIDPKRSELMARVRSKNSKPEIVVRRMAHRSGYRFRLHCRYLPGTPDLVFPKLKKIILVNGCFWHRHHGCSRATTPKTRESYWAKKFGDNMRRDESKLTQLIALGWDVLVVWECQTFDLSNLSEMVNAFLSDCRISSFKSTSAL